MFCNELFESAIREAREAHSSKLFESVLREMAVLDEQMFLGAFEIALKSITKNRTYNEDPEPDRTVSEVIARILREDPQLNPFAIKYRNTKGKKGRIIVFEHYEPIVRAANEERIEMAREDVEAAKTELTKKIAKSKLKSVMDTLPLITIVDEEEIRNWIVRAIGDLKVQDYRDKAIDAFMVMYYALPEILTPELVSARLEDLPVSPHSGGSVL